MKVFSFCEVFITSRMTRFLIQFQFTIDIDVVNLEKSWTDKDLTDLSKLLKANLGKKKRMMTSLCCKTYFLKVKKL